MVMIIYLHINNDFCPCMNRFGENIKKNMYGPN